ncbi:MAG: SIMPL domain-containing protein [Verrucomicrobia bacterium]|nr:MAG: SIMPL domain-containing protein [Verrucomicrobiota bacterium]
MNNGARPQTLGLLAGLFLSVGLMLSAVMFTRTWLKIAESQTISVTGSARKNVRSDLVVWHGGFSTEANTLLSAQRALKDDLAKVEELLRVNDVTNYLVSTISIQELHAVEKGQNEFAHQKTIGFRLSQSVEVRCPDPERIARLDRDSVTFVERGVLFTTVAPQYIYTKAGETKVEMLAEATSDARARAEQIAVQGGRVIDRLRSARMGVFQVTPMYDIRTSWDGMNDTSSLEKTITAVVTANFSLK